MPKDLHGAKLIALFVLSKKHKHTIKVMKNTKIFNGVFEVNENYKQQTPEDKNGYIIKSSYEKYKDALKEQERLRNQNPEKRFIIMEFEVSNTL